MFLLLTNIIRSWVMVELERSSFCEEKFDRENLISPLVSAPNASFTLEELNAKNDKWFGRRVRK